MSPTIISLVSFRLRLKKCVGYQMLTYPSMSWRVLFPIAKLQNAPIEALRHNKGLRGNVTGLQPCGRKTYFKKGTQNHFPSSRRTFTCIGIPHNFHCFTKKKERSTEKPSKRHGQGKSVYNILF